MYKTLKSGVFISLEEDKVHFLLKQSLFIVFNDLCVSFIVFLINNRY